jgi:hypothetical protein
MPCAATSDTPSRCLSVVTARANCCMPQQARRVYFGGVDTRSFQRRPRIAALAVWHGIIAVQRENVQA